MLCSEVFTRLTTPLLIAVFNVATILERNLKRNQLRHVIGFQAMSVINARTCQEINHKLLCVVLLYLKRYLQPYSVLLYRLGNNKPDRADRSFVFMHRIFCQMSIYLAVFYIFQFVPKMRFMNKSVCKMNGLST